MNSSRSIVEAIKNRLAKNASLSPIVDTAMLGLFGNNLIPTPQHGESMSSAMYNRDRALESMKLQGDAFASNPILNTLGLPNNKFTHTVGSLASNVLDGRLTDILGGNPGLAASSMHDSLGSQAMGNYGKLGPASFDESNDAMKALVHNFYRNQPSEADGNSKTSEEKLVGGKGDFKTDKEFNSKELKKGVKHETEHTGNKSIAKEIAKDHLSEVKDYYTRLAHSNIES